METTPKAIGRYIDRLGGSDGLAVAYEAGPVAFDAAAVAERGSALPAT